LRSAVKMRREKVCNLRDPPGSLRDQLINAGIMAGVDFFTTLGALGATGLLADPVRGLIAGAIAAGSGFFVTLAIQRGLYKKPPE